MKNDYEIRGDCVAIFLKRRDGTSLEALIDLKDLCIADSIDGTWHATEKQKKGIFYVYANGKEVNGRRSPNILHRMIMDAPSDVIVDHINHETLDNRRKNLRLVDKSANMQNRAGNQINNTSGYRGVYWDKSRSKWMVAVKVNRKMKFIGYYDDKETANEEAIKARSKHLHYANEGGEAV